MTCLGRVGAAQRVRHLRHGGHAAARLAAGRGDDAALRVEDANAAQIEDLGPPQERLDASAGASLGRVAGGRLGQVLDFLRRTDLRADVDQRLDGDVAIVRTPRRTWLIVVPPRLVPPRLPERLCDHHRLRDELALGLSEQVGVVDAPKGERRDREHEDEGVHAQQQEDDARTAPHHSRSR